MNKRKRCCVVAAMTIPLALFAAWTGVSDYLAPYAGYGEAEYTIDGSSFMGSSLLESPNWRGTATRRLQFTLHSGETFQTLETFYNADNVSQAFGANDFAVRSIIGDTNLIDGMAYIYGES